MTSKEIAIREMENKIQQKERELNQLQEELLSMKEKLEEYKKIPDSYYDTTLVSCRTFLWDINGVIELVKFLRFLSIL